MQNYRIALSTVLPSFGLVQTVVETSIFTRRADALLTRDERNDLIEQMARNPTAGALIPGLAGIRTLRFAGAGRGKSGGFRVIWYVKTEAQPILMLMTYGKNEQANPTPEQRKAMMAVVESMKRGPT